MDSDKKHRKTYKTSLVFRKPRKGHFSIEKIFHQVGALLADKVTLENLYMPCARILPWDLWNNLRTASKVSADVFHITGDIHYMVLPFPAQRTILTIHDCVFLHRSKGIKRSILKFFFLTWPVKHVRLITTISEKSKREIIQYSGCSPDKVIVVPNPVGELFYYSHREFQASRPTLLFIGSTPNKNLDRVIEALHGIHCELLILGNINEGQRARLHQFNISFRQMTGLPENELADTYTQVDMVLFPSTYEGFGLPIIEGQKSGRPVITSNISPMKEVAGEGACLVDPLDVQSIRAGVKKVIADSTYRESIVQKGFMNVQQYEAVAIANSYLKVYERIMAEN